MLGIINLGDRWSAAENGTVRPRWTPLDGNIICQDETSARTHIGTQMVDLHKNYSLINFEPLWVGRGSSNATTSGDLLLP
jgi:hypothetical protein